MTVLVVPMLTDLTMLIHDTFL